MEFKRKFINTADAMLYGRKEGETFGLAVAEFALAGKPIIASRIANARFHLETLGDRAITHQTAEELGQILATWPAALARNPLARDPAHPYKVYTSELVMANFQKHVETLLPGLAACTP